ncbi:hypothetical protein PQX77_012142 [Marasmius sp. AFHP31]|nr:hypothetical protein PQX77_012142 [Marasmius sp. AFHP31]
MGTAADDGFTIVGSSVDFSSSSQPISSVPEFTVTTFSVNPQSPDQSFCVATSFDEHVRSWFKKQAATDRAVSSSEGDGFLYAFRIEGVDFSGVTDRDISHTAAYKVGRTVDPENRQRQWHRQCPSQKHSWYEPVPVKHYRDVERLVHATLEEICVVRPHKVCTDCGCVHNEIFLMSDARGTFGDVILPVIEEMDRLVRAARGTKA